MYIIIYASQHLCTFRSMYICIFLYWLKFGVQFGLIFTIHFQWVVDLNLHGRMKKRNGKGQSYCECERYTPTQ